MFVLQNYNIFGLLASFCSNFLSAVAAAKSLQSCPTLCDPRDGSPPGSTVPGILQARTLEWVAISFSNAWKWKAKVKSLSRAQLPATSWTAAHQAPPSMGFSRQEYWSGVLLPSPRALLGGIKTAFRAKFAPLQRQTFTRALFHVPWNMRIFSLAGGSRHCFQPYISCKYQSFYSFTESSSSSSWG